MDGEIFFSLALSKLSHACYVSHGDDHRSPKYGPEKTLTRIIMALLGYFFLWTNFYVSKSYTATTFLLVLFLLLFPSLACLGLPHEIPHFPLVVVFYYDKVTKHERLTFILQTFLLF